MLEQGTTLHGKYQIIKKIGAGGMSTVWLAREENSERLWAVKDIDKTSKEFKAIANPDGTLSEVEIVKDLNHPFIPHVNDVYEDETSIKVVMEYVEGRNLKDILLKKGPIPEHLAVKIIKDLCQIFIYLHTRPDPVIYRDLKPGNIMIQSDGQIRLIDFGIAIRLKNEAPVKALGTKGFAAPEQFKGISDARSDIFTIGATLYSLLTGCIPTDKNAKYDDILERAPDIDSRLVKIVEKATQNDPELRHHNISELLKEISTYNERKIPVLKIALLLTGVFIIISSIACIVFFTLSDQDDENQVIKPLEVEQSYQL